MPAIQCLVNVSTLAPDTTSPGPWSRAAAVSSTLLQQIQLGVPGHSEDLRATRRNLLRDVGGPHGPAALAPRQGDRDHAFYVGFPSDSRRMHATRRANR